MTESELLNAFKNPEEFEHLITHIMELCDTASSFPQHADALINYLLGNPAEFKRIIENTDDLFRTAQSFHQLRHVKALINHVLNHPGEFKRLVKDRDDLFMLADSFLEDADSLINNTLNNPDESIRNMMNKEYLIGLGESFTQYARALINYLFDNPDKFKLIIKDNFHLLPENTPIWMVDSLNLTTVNNPDKFLHNMWGREYLVGLAESSRQNSYALINHVLNNPDEQQRIFGHIDDMFKFIIEEGDKTLVRANEKSPQHTEIVMYIVLKSLPLLTSNSILDNKSLGKLVQVLVLMGAELAAVFRALPLHVTTLDLSSIRLGNKSLADFAEIFRAIPHTLTMLALSEDDLTYLLKLAHPRFFSEDIATTLVESIENVQILFKSLSLLPKDHPIKERVTRAKDEFYSAFLLFLVPTTDNSSVLEAYTETINDCFENITKINDDAAFELLTRLTANYPNRENKTRPLLSSPIFLALCLKCNFENEYLKSLVSHLLTNDVSKNLTPEEINDHLELDILIKKINDDLPNDDNNASRQAAINRLKEQACHAHNDYSKPLSERKSSLEENLKAFNAFDGFAKEVVAVSEKYKGTSFQRLLSIEDIKKLVNPCYLSYTNGETAEICRESLVAGISAIHNDIKKYYKENGKLSLAEIKDWGDEVVCRVVKTTIKEHVAPLVENGKLLHQDRLRSKALPSCELLIKQHGLFDSLTSNSSEPKDSQYSATKNSDR